MRLRWKLLILFLAISLGPMLWMRYFGQRAVVEIGNDIAERAGEALSNQASMALGRLVEDHARVMRRERDIVELALGVQVAELEKLLAGPAPAAEASSEAVPLAPAYVTSRKHCRIRGMAEPGMGPGMGMGMGMGMGSMMGMDSMGRHMRPGEDLEPGQTTAAGEPDVGQSEDVLPCTPMRVSFQAQLLADPADPGPGTPLNLMAASGNSPAAELVRRLAPMTEVYAGLEAAHPDLILWQQARLDPSVAGTPASGLLSIFPAPQHLPLGDRGAAQVLSAVAAPQWVEQAKAAQAAVWTGPSVDPLTRQVVFTASAPLHAPDGATIGASSIMIPLHVVLAENQHIRAISQHVTSLLVSAGAELTTAENPSEAPVMILGGESSQLSELAGMGHWALASQPRPLELEPASELMALARDLAACESGVRHMLAGDEPVIVAYACMAPGSPALMLVVPEADVVEVARQAEEYVGQRVQRQIVTSGVMLLVVCLIVVLLSLVFARSLTVALQQVVAAVRRVARGDLDVRVEVATRDEIGELARTFNWMVPALKERMELKQGLELAREVQQSLLPDKDPAPAGLDIAAASTYSDETGGDLYDYVTLCCRAADQISLVVGDVSGHGIQAALLMASVRAFLRSRIMHPGDLAEIIGDVNRLIAEDTFETGQFVTLFLLELEPIRHGAVAAHDPNGLGCVRWVRAGHDPALLYDPATGEFEELMGPGPALGLEADHVFRMSERASIRPGQMVAVGTDGIWEAHNPAGEMFGRERYRKVLAAHAGQSAREIVTAVLDAVTAFRGEAPQEDDITLAVVVFREPEA